MNVVIIEKSIKRGIKNIKYTMCTRATNRNMDDIMIMIKVRPRRRIGFAKGFDEK
jgi:hypothetical protein